MTIDQVRVFRKAFSVIQSWVTATVMPRSQSPPLLRRVGEEKAAPIGAG